MPADQEQRTPSGSPALPPPSAPPDSKDSPVRALSAVRPRSNMNQGDGPPPRGSPSALSGRMATPGGEYEVFPINHRDTVKYGCPACGQILRYPIKFRDCGHRCCAACLPELLRSISRCPVDQSKIDKATALPDKEFQRELDRLQVKCSNYETACSWTGTYKQLQTHIDTDCQYKQVVCPNSCGAKFARTFLAQHVRDDCAKRQITCEFCSLFYLHGEQEEHMKSCTKYTLPCPNGCEQTAISRDEVQNHVDNICIKTLLFCPFSEAGCQHRCYRPQLDSHLRSSLDNHTTMVTDVLKSLNERMEEMETPLESRIAVSQIRIRELSMMYEEQMLWKIDKFSAKYIQAKFNSINNKPTSLQSSAIMTGRMGYRLKITCFLYGYQAAQGSHMSLYVNLCQTEYDALLPWPFRHKVEMTLLDRCEVEEDRKDIMCLIDSAEESEELTERPKNENNPMFGADEFVHIDLLKKPGHYIIDDAIYIKIKTYM